MVVAELDRRDLLVGGAAVAALLGIAACGGTDTARPAGATRTVDGASGPVTIPADPQRVVSTDFYSTYALLDVGYTVAATAQATIGGVLPAYQQVYGAIPKIGTPQAIDYEQIAARRPDLILGTLVPNLPPELGDRLGAIAPTVFFEASREPGTWQERAVRAADVVGRRAAAESLRTAYEQRARDIGARYASVLGRTRWALVRGGAQGNALVDLPNSWSGVVLGAVGARPGSVAEGRPGASVPLSYEQLGLLDDCDVVLHLVDTLGVVDENTRRVLEQPTFTSLPAARAGHVYPLPNYYVAHYKQGDAVLSELETILAGL